MYTYAYTCACVCVRVSTCVCVRVRVCACLWRADGSLDDAMRGTALSRELAQTELSRWFHPDPPTIIGTALRVLEV